MKTLLILLLVLAVLFLLLLLLLRPDPSARKKMAPFVGRRYAHRGLHCAQDGIPENSLPAFRRAVEAGYGIELDLHLTTDGQLVVFHDDTLDRVCGVTGRVDEKSYAELQQLRLLGTEERIPLFSEVLDIVAGKIPMIVEVKYQKNYPALCEKMMSQLRTGTYTHLLVWKIDRISRNLLDFAEMYQELKDLGVTFVSKNEQFDTSTAMGEAMLKIILVFAELERNMTSERVAATMISRASNGQWNGGRIPYGYDYDPEEQTFSFNSDEYNIAHLIHDKYEELRSLVYLARYLNEHGYRTRAGNDWSPVSLDIILRSVFYCGDYQYNRLKEGDRQRPKDKSEWITVKDHHPAIVSRGQKERILALLESNRRLKSFRKSGKSKYTHIFSGLLICGNCGQPMTSSISTVKKTTGRRYSLYFCPTHRKSKLWCTGKSTSDPIIGEFVFNYILNMLNAQKAFSPETSIQELEQQLLSGDTFSPVAAIAPDGLQDLFHTLRTGTVKGEVFGKDVKIKTDSEPPLQLSKLKKEKIRLERAIDRLNKLFLYSEKAMSESEYLTQKIQLSDSLEEVEDKLAFLASEDSLQQSITDDEFISKASNFILSQKLTDRNYVSFQSLSATVSPEVLDSFLSSIIDNIVFKDGAVHSITFRNGLSHTFIYKEKPEV